MKDQTNDQPGAQQHAEGEYGDKAREANREQLQRGEDQTDELESNPLRRREGRHRIHEDRQQHDEADKNSDKDRIRHDREKGRTNDPRGRVGEK
jgi:hypothetical protein